MKNFSFYYSLLLFFFFFSCSTYIEVHKPLIKDYAFKENETQTYCEIKKQSPYRFAYATENEALYKNLQVFLQNRTAGFTPIERAVLISLIHMNVRPDQVSPSSGLQVLINNSGQQQYYSFVSSSSNEYPFLNGLKTLLKIYKSPRTLGQLAKIIDEHYNYNFLVDNQLHQFLSSHSALIASNPSMQKLYFHDDEILNKGELLPRLNFSSISSWNSSPVDPTENLISDKIHSYFIEKNQFAPEISCNVDFELYKNNIFDILAEKKDSLSLAYLDEKNFSFIANISQQISKSSSNLSLNKTLLFAGSSKNSKKPNSLCMINFPGSHQINMLIAKDRDTGQQMDHFLGKDLQKIKNINDLDLYVRESRYLFLNTPPRLIIESERSSQSQLENIMKLNFPIYHARSIAESIGSITFKNGTLGLIIDDRSETKLFCPYNNEGANP